MNYFTVHMSGWIGHWLSTTHKCRLDYVPKTSSDELRSWLVWIRQYRYPCGQSLHFDYMTDIIFSSFHNLNLSTFCGRFEWNNWHYL